MPSRKNSVVKLNAGILTVCMLGLGLSYYAYFVEVAKEKDDSYEAMCDISERVSCTKAFGSVYGKGFGIIPENSILYAPNPVYGLIAYTLVAVLGILDNYTASLLNIIIGIFANISSVYLAYVLYLLNDICVICVSTYVVNAIILILVVKKHRRLFQNEARRKKKAH